MNQMCMTLRAVGHCGREGVGIEELSEVELVFRQNCNERLVGCGQGLWAPTVISFVVCLWGCR